MDRRSEILKYIDRKQLGIEIGPWHSPLASKADGYNCLVMDLFDTDTLRSRAVADPHVPDALAACIEDVDLVGPANSLKVLAEERRIIGDVDYIISSHNIEHIPDPISFFQDCSAVLKPGGHISMAIPDRRACFDFFRPFTSLSAWIEAHVQRRTRPTYAQVFELACLGADYDRGATRSAGFDLATESPEKLVPFNLLKSSYADWQRRLSMEDTEYQDTHCWAFTPSCFELLLRDSRYLGLVPLDIVEISPTRQHEFFAHLVNGTHENSLNDETAYLTQRAYLMHRVIHESGRHSLGQVHTRESNDIDGPTKQFMNDDPTSAQVLLEAKRQADIAAALRARVTALEQSTSWRITAPIRAIGRLLKISASGTA